jgi:hypothetical protein
MPRRHRGRFRGTRSRCSPQLVARLPRRSQFSARAKPPGLIALNFARAARAKFRCLRQLAAALRSTLRDDDTLRRHYCCLALSRPLKPPRGRAWAETASRDHVCARITGNIAIPRRARLRTRARVTRLRRVPRHRDAIKRQVRRLGRKAVVDDRSPTAASVTHRRARPRAMRSRVNTRPTPARSRARQRLHEAKFVFLDRKQRCGADREP